jgi:hypothetical protein
MFDTNQFKRAVKEWVKVHPKASVNDLADFCENQIPPQSYVTHGWLVEQTVEWFQYIQNSRKTLYSSSEEE